MLARPSISVLRDFVPSDPHESKADASNPTRQEERGKEGDAAQVLSRAVSPRVKPQKSQIALKGKKVSQLVGGSSASEDIAVLQDTKVSLEVKWELLRTATNVTNFAAGNRLEHKALEEVTHQYAKDFALKGGISAIAQVVAQALEHATKSERNFRIKRDAGALSLARARLRADDIARKNSSLEEKCKVLRDSEKAAAFYRHENEQLKFELGNARQELKEKQKAILALKARESTRIALEEKLIAISSANQSFCAELDNLRASLKEKNAKLIAIEEELIFQKNEAMLDVFHRQVKITQCRSSQTDNNWRDSYEKAPYSSRSALVRPASAKVSSSIQKSSKSTRRPVSAFGALGSRGKTNIAESKKRQIVGNQIQTSKEEAVCDYAEIPSKKLVLKGPNKKSGRKGSRLPRPSTAPSKRRKNTDIRSAVERAQYFDGLCEKLQALGQDGEMDGLAVRSTQRRREKRPMSAKPPRPTRPLSAAAAFQSTNDNRIEIHPCLKQRPAYRLASPGPQRGSKYVSKGLGVIKQ